MNKTVIFINLCLISVFSQAEYAVELVKDINKGRDGSGINRVDYQFDQRPAFSNGKFYFAAHEDNTGIELWTTDGTSAGTHIVADLYSGTPNGRPAGLTDFNGQIYYASSDASGMNNKGLYKIDESGNANLVTDKVRVAPGRYWNVEYPIAIYQNKMFFAGYTPETGVELWQTDGTDNGTQLISEITPGPGGADIFHITSTSTGVYLSADDGIHGRELWRFDGHQLTMEVDYIHGSEPAINFSGYIPQNITEINGQIFFVQNGTGNMWTIDNLGSTPRLVQSFESVPEMTHTSDQLFITANYNNEGGEVWVTDSTGFEPLLLDDLTTTNNASTVVARHATGGVTLNGKTVLRGGSINDTGLRRGDYWLSDGTPYSAIPVITSTTTPDISAGAWHEINAFDNTLFFAANDGVNGVEIWSSDGNVGSEVMLSDIHSGSESSWPYGFWTNNTVLYFFASTPRKGVELWKITKISSDSGSTKGGGKKSTTTDDNSSTTDDSGSTGGKGKKSR